MGLPGAVRLKSGKVNSAEIVILPLSARSTKALESGAGTKKVDFRSRPGLLTTLRITPFRDFEILNGGGFLQVTPKIQLAKTFIFPIPNQIFLNSHEFP